MSYPLISRRCTIPAALALLGLLASCAAPPVSPGNGSNITLEMRRMQAAVTAQEQEINQLALQIDALEIRLQQQEQELDRLRQAQPGSTGYDQTAPSPYAPAVPERTMQGQDDGSPTEVYLRAFGDYASGRYQAAVLGFETFLQRFPNNGYASNAQFWLADCYFNQQQYAMAIQEFNKVINDYPRSAKSPDALLKIATAQLQLGRAAEARQTVDRLGRQFPESTAAQKAQELAIP